MGPAAERDLHAVRGRGGKFHLKTEHAEIPARRQSLGQRRIQRNLPVRKGRGGNRITSRATARTKTAAVCSVGPQRSRSARSKTRISKSDSIAERLQNTPFLSLSLVESKVTFLSFHSRAGSENQ